MVSRTFRSDRLLSEADAMPSGSPPTMNRTALPSMRFLSRDRTIDERGYVLISAIALAVLYFGLMELMLIDSSRALREAQRFRSRVVASALAESAAELAAAQMVTSPGGPTSAEDEQGKMLGSVEVSGNAFELVGEGNATGVVPIKATVRVQGRIINGHISVDYTFHSQ